VSPLQEKGMCYTVIQVQVMTARINH
jgi:hypothetical protein